MYQMMLANDVNCSLFYLVSKLTNWSAFFLKKNDHRDSSNVQKFMTEVEIVDF